MKSLLSLAGIVYLFSLLFAVPAIIYFTWGLFFFPELSANATILLIGKLAAWIIFGGIYVNVVAKYRLNKIRAVAKAVMPEDFLSRFEIFGGGADRYLTISPSTYQLVVVDLSRNLARCEPISFVKSYNLENGERQSILTIRLADFDYPTMTFHFGRMHRHDITSRLENALLW